MFFTRLTSILIALIALSLSLPVSPSAAEATKESSPTCNEQRTRQITVEEVNEIVNNINEAVKNKNVDEITKYFAPFIYSEITVTNYSDSETIILNGLTENKLYLQEGLKDVKNSEELYKYVQVRLSPDEKMAFVHRSKIVSVTTNKGEEIMIQSEAEARLAIVEGKLQIISIKENSEAALRPQK